jgi:hypothetical protein
MEEDARVHGCFKKFHCNLKSVLSFALSKLELINQLVTTIVLQPKSPITNITSLSQKGKAEAQNRVLT